MTRFDNSLILEDFFKLSSQLPDHYYDCCIADPPYNISHENKREIGWYKSNPTWKEKKKFKLLDESWDSFSEEGYEAFTHSWIEEMKRVLKPNANIFIFGTYHNIFKIGYALEKQNLRVINSIVWYKRNAFPNITGRMFCESTEYVIWAVNNTYKNAKNWTFNYQASKDLNQGKQLRNMWDIPMTPLSEKSEGKHPSQKPIELIRRLLICGTNEGDKVIDPFMGSGTVPVTCKALNRVYTGVEMNEEYYSIAKRRIEKQEQSLSNYRESSRKSV